MTTGALDSLPPLRDVIRRHGLAAKKSLGQNFLFDLNLAARIPPAGAFYAHLTVVVQPVADGVSFRHFASIDRK